MFYSLILKNESGDRIDLSKTANRFMFSKIEGLNPPAGTISTSFFAGMDGSYLNNAFIEKRNVVISLDTCHTVIKKDENGGMVVDPKESDVVRFIFSSALNGIGIYKIAQMLHKRNVPTRKGSKWSSSTVKGILTNEKYYGAAMFQKTYTDSNFKRHTNCGQVDSYYVSDHHEPIISKEDFDNVQLILQMHIKERRIVKDTGKYQKKYPFSGIIICGECGGKFKRQTQSVGVAWACSTHLYHKSECSMKFIKDEAVKAAFVTMLNKLIFGYKLVLIPYYEAILISETDESVKDFAAGQVLLLEIISQPERRNQQKSQKPVYTLNPLL